VSERDRAWRPGKFDSIELGNGGRIDIQVSKDGRVMAVLTGIEVGAPIDITPAACPLGCGLQEASARAAQIRHRGGR